MIRIVDYSKIVQEVINEKNSGRDLQDLKVISFIPKRTVKAHFYEFDAKNNKKDNCIDIFRGVKKQIQVTLNAVLKGGLNNLLGYVNFIEDVEVKGNIKEEQKAEQNKNEFKHEEIKKDVEVEEVKD